MDVRFINPFLVAAFHVLKEETGAEVRRGDIALEEFYFTADDVTVLIGVTGMVKGFVLYGMSRSTATRLISATLKEPVPFFNSMVESGIAEMGNVIAGLATVDLEKNGYQCTISPPTVLIGKGVVISTVNIKGLHVPLECEHGRLQIWVALKNCEG